MRKRVYCFLSLLILLTEDDCLSQNKNNTLMITREPVVAGRFYPSSEEELTKDLQDFFSQLETIPAEGDVRAIIVPHAGYEFSGEVAARGFSQVPADKVFDNIFIIGSSHHAYFEGASIYNQGNYKTPLGEAIVNIKLANKLINNNKFIVYYPEAHHKEHSLEVQVPFIQHYFSKTPKIIPIVIGTQHLPTIEKISQVLQPYFDENNLFIISSDFSHYPPYDEAVKVDNNTATAITRNNPKVFLNALKENKRQNYLNLQTSICGWTSVLTLLNLTNEQADFTYRKVFYQNSGDKPYGSKDRVVGYYAIVVTRAVEVFSGRKEFALTAEDKKQLLDIARNTIAFHAKTGKLLKVDTTKLSETLRTPTGAFVSLHKFNKLRGCIGRFHTSDPLYKVIQQMAIASAFQDCRFPPVSTEEVQELTIEISVLSPMKRIHDISEIQLGKHGIYMKKGANTGTFLPQVATETGWDLDHFLGHCARDKAKIGWDGWKSADLFVYEAEIFDEHLLLP